MTTSRMIGLAGQLATMAELAYRGYNVAIPQVDNGRDIVAFNDRTDQPYLIQVKTGRKESLKGKHKGKYKYQFSIRRAQLESKGGAIVFVFVARLNSAFYFIVIERAALEVISNAKRNSGSTSRTFNLRVYLVKDKNGDWMATKNIQGTRDSLSSYLEDWALFKRILN